VTWSWFFATALFRCFGFDDRYRIVGAGRAVADGRDCACLCDIAVLRGLQGRGLGREIVGKLVDLCRFHRKIILYAMPGREQFYEQFGFKRMATAMACFRNEDKAISRRLLLCGSD
jgi:GNAT superfamily N-acetyltransferase